MKDKITAVPWREKKLMLVKCLRGTTTRADAEEHAERNPPQHNADCHVHYSFTSCAWLPKPILLLSFLLITTSLLSSRMYWCTHCHQSLYKIFSFKMCFLFCVTAKYFFFHLKCDFIVFLCRVQPIQNSYFIL